MRFLYGARIQKSEIDIKTIYTDFWLLYSDTDLLTAKKGKRHPWRSF